MPTIKINLNEVKVENGKSMWKIETIVEDKNLAETIKQYYTASLRDILGENN